MSTLDPQTGDLPGSGSGHGALATIENVVHQVPALSWSYGPPQRPEILKSKPNVIDLLHAVRRRWPLAIGLGVLCSSLVAVLVWYLVPVRYEAFALLKVSGKSPVVLGKSADASDGEFSVYKRTQVDLIRSSMVLLNTVREPEISKLSMVAEHNDDPVTWLSEQLIIDYPNDAEILRIAMKGKKPSEVTKIVNMVVAKYLKEIVEHDKDLRSKQKFKLESSYRKTQDEVNKELKALHDLEQLDDAATSDQVILRKRLASDQLATAMATRNKLVAEISHNALQIQIMQAQQLQKSDDLRLENQLETHPQVAPALQMLSKLQEILAEEEAKAVRRDDPKVRQWRDKIARMEERIDTLKSDLRPKLQDLVTAGGGGGSVYNNMTLPMLEVQKQFLEGALKEADETLEKLVENFKDLEKFSATVTSKREELASKIRVQSATREQLNLIEVEVLAQDRITKLDDATVPGGSGDAVRKYIGLVFASVLAFGLVVMGVAVTEFQARRVNSVYEVNDGLGIRVIGELPSLSGRAWRRMKGGKGANVLQALMAERIDGTRTALIHTTTIDPPRVVMISSAEPHEGKTTTATQLAASLARSGRRTLLIDADIRNAGAHRVFDMPQEPGLCELLRGEIATEAVVHPTRTPNLWLLPGGRCDLRSVQALSTNTLGSAIAALCVQFDYVVIDSGPVLKVADPLLVGQHVDAVILSVLKDVSRVPQVYEACERLRSVGITVMGAVVNGVKDDVARHGVELLLAETN